MTQGHPLPGYSFLSRRPRTRDQLCANPLLGAVSAPALGIELFAECRVGSPFLSGSLQFKNIKVPVVLVFHGPSYPRWDVVKGHGGE